MSILISYSLAGPSAYSLIIQTIYAAAAKPPVFSETLEYVFIPHLTHRHAYLLLIIPFILFWAMFVIGCSRIITKVISWATLVKGTLLLVMIGLVGVVANHINQSFTDNWSSIMRPLLVSTVALGGSMNTLPVIYAKMKPTVQSINAFRIASCAAILSCFVLNVLWCYFALRIVPQNSTDPSMPSLERSRKNQDPGFVPIVQMIAKSFPQYNWLSIIIQVFISLSVSVSFVTMSAGLKHVLDGHVQTFQENQIEPGTISFRVSRWLASTRLLSKFDSNETSKNSTIAIGLQCLLYFVAFSTILISAQVFNGVCDYSLRLTFVVVFVCNGNYNIVWFELGVWYFHFRNVDYFS
jgi:hypothetical protein